MEQIRKTVVLGFALLITGLIPGRGTGQEVNPPAGAAAEGAAPALAVINGTPVTAGDLEYLYLTRAVRPELRDSVRDRYIEDLIDRTLLRQFLDSRKLKPDAALVNERVQRVEKLITRKGLDFDEALRTMGYTPATFREEAAWPLAWRMHARLVITEEALRQFHDAHRMEFDGTEVRAAHVVRRVPAGGSEADRDRVLAELTALRERLIAGELTFADAARTHSESPTARDGGDLGSFSFRGRMPVEIAGVAFRLKPGEISEPFQSRFGLHLLTVTEIIPGDLSLEDSRPELFERLSDELRVRLVQELRAKATIQRAAGPGTSKDAD